VHVHFFAILLFRAYHGGYLLAIIRLQL